MSAAPIIVTRPENDAGSLVSALEGLGIEPVLAPLLHIDYKPDVQVPDVAFQAVLVTSANSCRALARLPGRTALRDVLTIAVGETSARTARDGGQTNVVTAGGDVNGLIATTLAQCRPENGPLLYVSGVQTAGELQDRLKSDGYDVHRVVAYEAVAVKNLPESVRHLLTRQAELGVVLYSPRTAHIWCKLLAETKTADRGANLTHFCLSENVARVVCDAIGSCGGVVIADEPSERAMIAAIREVAQT